MNTINENIDFLKWCNDFCKEMNAPHFGTVRLLKEAIEIRDAIRYRGISKRTVDREYIEREYYEQADAQMKHWMPMLKLKEEEQ